MLRKASVTRKTCESGMEWVALRHVVSASWQQLWGAPAGVVQAPKDGTLDQQSMRSNLAGICGSWLLSLPSCSGVDLVSLPTSASVDSSG